MVLENNIFNLAIYILDNINLGNFMGKVNIFGKITLFI